MQLFVIVMLNYGFKKFKGNLCVYGSLNHQAHALNFDNLDYYNPAHANKSVVAAITVINGVPWEIDDDDRSHELGFTNDAYLYLNDMGYGQDNCQQWENSTGDQLPKFLIKVLPGSTPAVGSSKYQNRL